MSKERGKATLGDVKGAELLRALAANTAKRAPPAPKSPPEAKPTPSSEDDRWLQTFESRLQPQPPSFDRISNRPQRKAEPPKRNPTYKAESASDRYDPRTAPQRKRVPPKKQQRSAKAAEKNSLGQKIVRVPASVVRDVKAQSSLSPKEKTGGAMSPQPYDFGRAAFDKIRAMRERLETFSASHGAPVTVSNETRAQIDDRIARGAAQALRIIDRDDGFFFGNDFGTSTTKAVLRHPHMPTAPAFAAPVPLEFASRGQAHLWPTAIWYHKSTGRFSPYPQEGWVCLQGFKSALVENQNHRICCGSGLTMLQASAAFLALHIAYVLGAALERVPALRLAGINFAVPVAALKNSSTAETFEKLIAKAVSLVPEAANLTVDQLQTPSASRDEAIPVYLCTELSAAIAGYCSAPRYYQGGHMIIDCGSATLDMASFYLGEERWPIEIHGASVERLGADACVVYEHNGATGEECVKAAQFQEHTVWKRAAQGGNGGFVLGRDGKYPYQIILIGGGLHGAIHEQMIGTMEPAFRYPFHRPQLSSDLEFDSSVGAGRLVLADGLARDPIDLREVIMPDDRGSPSPNRGGGLPYGPGFVSKDDV